MKKGFTLIEVLAVIVILAIILGIATRAILRTVERNNKKSWELTLEGIEKAALTYALEYFSIEELEEVDEEGNVVGKTVTLGELRESRYLTKKVIHPSTKKEITEMEIIVKKEDEEITAEIENKETYQN